MDSKKINPGKPGGLQVGEQENVVFGFNWYCGPQGITIHFLATEMTTPLR